jgi:DNA repair protein RadC
VTRHVDPQLSAVREFARERAQRSSLRILASEIGIGHTTLNNFLDGAKPHPRIWRALREWYERENARGAVEREPVTTDQLRRARERMRTLGPRVLSAPELVAVVLDSIVPGTGPGLDASRNLLREFSPSDAQALRRIMAARLSTVSGARGLGDAKAAVLLAGLEIGRRAVEEGREERDKFTSAAEVFTYLHPSMRDQPHETFRVLLLDHERGLRRELAVGPHRVTAVGAVNLRDVFRVGLVEGAHGIVLVQSQPSGKPSPSALDRVITKLFNKGCQTLGFVAYDHIIIGENGYFSAREAGALRTGGECEEESDGLLGS